jgi:carboxymethylenebutenolidase
MQHRTIDLVTDDGTCPVHVFQRDTGARPAAIMFPDAFGLRPALFEIAERVAAAGFYVMLPNLYYRTGYEPPGFQIFSDPAIRADFMTRIAPTVAAAPIMRDMKTFLAHLDAGDAVDGAAVGVFGYCLGGRLALVAAGTHPERVVAAAAYHPGFVATDAPDSPHLLAPNIEARV